MKWPTFQLRYLRWAGYALAYLLAFLLFAYVSFPYERLKHYLVARYNASQVGANPDKLEIGALSWSWHFPGVVAEDVRLTLGAEPRAATARTELASEAEKPLPRYLEAEELFISVSPLALLGGVRSATFGANALGGEISGWARDSESQRRLELQLDGIDPGALPQVAAAIGLPISGRVSGHITVDLPENNLMKAEGAVDLSAEDLVLGDGKAKIQGTIALPELHMGTFTLKAGITGGRLKIEECVAQGRDLDLSLSGGLRLRKRLEGSLAELELTFRFSDKYKTQSDLTKALFGQPDSKVPGLFDTVTSSNLTKQDDGSYAARLYGPFNRLKPKPLLTKRSSSTNSNRKRTRASRRAERKSTTEVESGEPATGEEPLEDSE